MKINLNKRNQKKLEKLGFEVVVRGKYSIHKNIRIEPTSRLRVLCGGDIQMGAFSYSGTTRMDNETNVEIGRYCSISEQVKFNIIRKPVTYISNSGFQGCRDFLGRKENAHLPDKIRLSAQLSEMMC
jgi:hypothetical protein